MEQLKFYPLIDCDSDGIEKSPMFFSTDEHTVRQKNKFYLTEIVPYYYRLCTGTASTDALSKNTVIHCPYCGKAMKTIAPAVDHHKLSLFVCPRCR